MLIKIKKKQYFSTDSHQRLVTTPNLSGVQQHTLAVELQNIMIKNIIKYIWYAITVQEAISEANQSTKQASLDQLTIN